MPISTWKRAVITCILLIAIVPLLWPTEFSNYNLARARFVTQESSGAPSTEFALFGFTASAYFQPESATPQASVISPTSSNPRNLSPGLLPGSMNYQVDYYFSEFQVDVEFPPGNYTVILEPDAQTVQQAQIQVPSGSFPAPVHLTDFTILQSVDPAQELVLDLSDSGLTGGEDFIQVIISDGAAIQFHTPAPGVAGALPASTSSVTVPPGSLYAGGKFTLSLISHDVASIDTVQLPGITGTAATITITRIQFETTGSFFPDTNAPLMIKVMPETGSTGADPDAAVTFTFNEPMDTGVSIAWDPVPGDGAFSCNWSGDGQILTCIPAEGFPLGAEIRWTLNPTPEDSQMADQQGNRIPTGLVTGNFFTSTARYGIAPAELLPGPTALIGNDPSSGKTSVKVAAESLKGFIIQKSNDLENWEPVESITVNSSLVELPVPEPTPSAPVFYRATRNAYTPDFVYEDIAERSRIVYPDGGTVETVGSNGIRFVLTFPAGAVAAPTRIHITPLLEILPTPLSQGLVAGARLEPGGLNLLKPAELRMYLPASVNPVDLIGFQSKSSGFNFHWHPWAIENGNEIVMDLVHFSTAGVGRGTPEEHQAMTLPCDPMAELDHQLAIISAQIATAIADKNQRLKSQLADSANTLIQQAGDSLVAPAFNEATVNRNAFPCAIRDYVRLNTRSVFYSGKAAAMPANAENALQFAWDVSYGNCIQLGDYREVANLLWLQAVDKLIYGKILQNAGQQEMANCLPFKMDFHSSTYYSGWEYRGRHEVQANAVSIVPGADLSHIAGSGALVYKAFELAQIQTDCDPGVKDLNPVNGGLNIWKGYIFSRDFLYGGCDCASVSMDPDTWSKLDFGLVFLIDAPPLEFWQECSPDPITGQPTYSQQGGTKWKDSFAAAHEDGVNFNLSGTNLEPLYLAFTDFDFLDQDVNGRHVVGQKQVFRFLPDLDPLWWDFENTNSETWITIWNDNPASSSN